MAKKLKGAGRNLPPVDVIQLILEAMGGGVVDYTTLMNTLNDSLEALNGGYSMLVGKPSGGNFTTAYLGADTITIGTMPTIHPTLIDEDIKSVIQINAAGVVVETYLRSETAMNVAASVLTVTGATFAALDTFVVETNVALLSNPNYAEDSTHTNGDTGTAIWGVRNDAGTALAGDGKYSPFMFDGDGHIYSYDKKLHVDFGAIADASDITGTSMAKLRYIGTIQDAMALVDGSLADAALVTGSRQAQLRYIGEALAAGIIVGGNVAHDAVDSGNPSKIGYKAYDSQPADVDVGDRVNGIARRWGGAILAGYNWVTDALKVVVQNPLWSHRTTPETVYDDTQASGASSIDRTAIQWDTYKGGSAEIRLTNPASTDPGATTGTITVTAWATNNPSVTLPPVADDEWVDVSTDLLGSAGLVLTVVAATDVEEKWFAFLDTDLIFEYLMFKVDYQVVTAGTLSTGVIYLKKGY